eukprot:COSAG02_NODE_54175_length_297_cov_1.207071_1_plen_26_part_10
MHTADSNTSEHCCLCRHRAHFTDTLT